MVLARTILTGTAYGSANMASDNLTAHERGDP
jgi:hypothetical protein